jgi:hypothetical protein
MAGGVQWAHVLALMGDASDNVPGVKGIGLKSALALVQQFGTVESVLEHAAEVKPALPVQTRRTYLAHRALHLQLYLKVHDEIAAATAAASLIHLAPVHAARFLEVFHRHGTLNDCMVPVPKSSRPWAEEHSATHHNMVASVYFMAGKEEESERGVAKRGGYTEGAPQHEAGHHPERCGPAPCQVCLFALNRRMLGTRQKHCCQTTLFFDDVPSRYSMIIG